MWASLNDKNVDLQHYMDHSDVYDRVAEVSEFKDEVLEIFRQRKEGYYGDAFLWNAKLKFRKGEITSWCGVNGHGKSLVMGQVALDLLNQGKKVFIASLEMPPADTIARMARQFTWSEFPTEKQLDDMFAWREDYLYLFNFVGSINRNKVIALCRYAQKIGCDHVIIDSLMKCTGDDDDYGVQKGIVNDLCEVAKEVGIHVHLICHSRKQKDVKAMIDINDIFGSSAIQNLSHNIVLIHRNITKEQETEARGIPDNTVPDQIIGLRKQRNGEIQYMDVELWFDRKSQSFSTDFGVMPDKYLNN